MSGKKKNEGGRPIKWTPKAIEDFRKKLEHYLETTEVPLLQEFCWKEGYSHQLISDLAKKCDKFSDTVKREKDKATADLIRQGLKAKHKGNASVIIFLLKNIANMRDKQEVEMSGSLGLPQLIAETVKRNEEKQNS